MILMIDNYDSFTFNVVQYLLELGADVTVRRNDEINIEDIKRLAPEKIVVSPGPCTPNEAGISLQAVACFAGKTPWVFVGHQSIGQGFGGKVVRAKEVMHGKTSMIYHKGTGVFTDLDNPFLATRYHSLVVDAESLPDCLEITAWTEENGEIDAIMDCAIASMTYKACNSIRNRF